MDEDDDNDDDGDDEKEESQLPHQLCSSLTISDQPKELPPQPQACQMPFSPYMTMCQMLQFPQFCQSSPDQSNASMQPSCFCQCLQNQYNMMSGMPQLYQPLSSQQQIMAQLPQLPQVSPIQIKSKFTYCYILPRFI